LDTEGKRLYSQYYTKDYATAKEQKTFERNLFEKTRKSLGEWSLTGPKGRSEAESHEVPTISVRTQLHPKQVAGHTRSSLPNTEWSIISRFFSLQRLAGEILMFDGQVILYRNTNDVLFYVIGPADENELILACVLSTIQETLSTLLR
jgi:hypothetical protein